MYYSSFDETKHESSHVRWIKKHFFRVIPYNITISGIQSIQFMFFHFYLIVSLRGNERIGITFLHMSNHLLSYFWKSIDTIRIFCIELLYSLWSLNRVQTSVYILEYKFSVNDPKITSNVRNEEININTYLTVLLLIYYINFIIEHYLDKNILISVKEIKLKIFFDSKSRIE
jgi:hypothetical protein